MLWMVIHTVGVRQMALEMGLELPRAQVLQATTLQSTDKYKQSSVLSMCSWDHVIRHHH